MPRGKKVGGFTGAGEERVAGGATRVPTDPSARPRRVLFVGDFSASKLGNQSVAEDLVGRLGGGEIEVLTTSDKTRKFVRVAEILLDVWRVRKWIDVASIDVFSGNAFLWAEMAAALLKRASVPFVLVLHGGALPAFAARHPERVRRLFCAAERVVTPSPYLGERLHEHLAHYQVIPNPIDLSRYTFRHRKSVSPRLVWLRSFHRIYNPTLAPRVVAHLLERFPDVHLSMVGADKGDGSLAETRRVARELGVAEHIDFVGGVPKAEVPERLAAGDILLNTPTIDNTPVSVVEALATGLCVVSTEVGGIPYLVENGVQALLTPADDDAAMAEAVARILTEPGLAGRLSVGGRELARAHDWDVVLPMWRELLLSVRAHDRDWIASGVESII